MQQLTINTSFNIDLGFELAPIHKRMLATVLDIIIMAVYIWAMVVLVFNNFKDKDYEDNTMLIITCLLYSPVLFYHLLSELLMDGESVGKKIMGIRVISLDGNKPSISQYLLRWFLRTVDFSMSFYLGGIICAAVTKNGQRIGDLAAGTTVVSKKLPYNISQTIFKHVQADNYIVSYPEVMRLSDRDINTINNIVQNHYKSSMYNDVLTVAEKVKNVLGITSPEEPLAFLNTLLNDYNYLSQNK